MFKKQYRLNTSEFKEVFNFGKTVKTPLFLVKSKVNNKANSRFSVVVSKKISKKAVERNYLKRRFYHALKEVYSIFPKNDYVFILNSEIKDIQYKDLIKKIKELSV